MSIRLAAMPTAVQKTAELGSHNTHGEQQQQQQPQQDENSNSYNNNNNKGYCLVAPVDCSSAHREYRSCCAANRRRLCSTWPNCQRYPSLPPRPYPQHPLSPPPPFLPQRRSTAAWRSPDWWFVYFDWVKISFSTRAARRFRQCGRSKVTSPSRGRGISSSPDSLCCYCATPLRIVFF